jgi:uncharacterized low-complexity protein
VAQDRPQAASDLHQRVFAIVAKSRTRFHTRLPIALIAALLIVGLAAMDAAPASAGPTASVAKKKKKKCTKKKRSKGKCGKAKDVAATVTALIAGSSFRSSFDYPSSSADGTVTEEYEFCRNGRYRFRNRSTGTIHSGLDPVPFDDVTTYGGTWKLKEAERAGTYALKGILVLTADSFQTNAPEGSLGHDPPPSPDSHIFVAPFAKPIFTIGDHPVWTRTPGGAGC